MPLTIAVRSGYHAEAIAWAAAASVSGPVSTKHLRAVSEFCRDIDRAGIRDKFIRLSLLYGQTLSQALVPLYTSTTPGGTVIGNATDTNNNFVSGDYNAATTFTGWSDAGLRGGSTKWLDTGVPADTPTSGNRHLCVHLSSALANVVNLIGIQSASSPACYWSFGYKSTSPYAALAYASNSTTAATLNYSNSAPSLSGASPSKWAHGTWIGNHTSSSSLTLRRYYTGGLPPLAVSNATANALTATNSVSWTIPVLAVRTSSTALSYAATSVRMRSYSIGSAMDAGQSAEYDWAIRRFTEWGT